MHDRLGFHKVCARWVSRMLTPQHKMQRMGLALQHLNRYHDEGHDMPARIVTGDESWVRHYQPETKRVWEHPTLSRISATLAIQLPFHHHVR
ncbi:hypothetical protein B7P43_G09076 [Cryptotermes secundus]|uniref:Transposase n=1 Tax=Cryptotermes secundus TaxID=105785 RepID=A0A2J7PLE0_9NEOP|nr:hypothetical protein B7P43_G09076 [Cryptotermes secundus]